MPPAEDDSGTTLLPQDHVSNQIQKKARIGRKLVKYIVKSKITV